MNPRSLFRPKLKELPEQCSSCPFRTGNDTAFAVILNRLRKMMGLPPMKGKDGIQFARVAVRADIAHGGDFACHLTAYIQEDMTVKPKSEWRQCPGATAAYRNADVERELRDPAVKRRMSMAISKRLDPIQ